MQLSQHLTRFELPRGLESVSLVDTKADQAARRNSSFLVDAGSILGAIDPVRSFRQPNIAHHVVSSPYGGVEAASNSTDLDRWATDDSANRSRLLAAKGCVVPRRPDEPGQRRLVRLLGLLNSFEDASQLARRLKLQPKTDAEGHRILLLAIYVVLAHSKVKWIVIHRLAAELASEEGQ